MKKFLIIALVMFFALPTMAQNQIVGKWNTEGGEGKVEVYKTGNTFSGKIIWLKNGKNADGSDKLDSKNPDKSKQKNTIKGTVILTGLKYDDGEWDGGRIYDPESGKSYKCSVKMDNGQLKLKGKWGPVLQNTDLDKK